MEISDNYEVGPSAVRWISARLVRAKDAYARARDRIGNHRDLLEDASEVSKRVGTVSTTVMVAGLIGMRNGIDTASIVALVGGAHVTGHAIGLYLEELLRILDKPHDRHE